MDDEINTHPIQVHRGFGRPAARVRTEVTMRAYEVYKHVYGEQKALITDDCRGGFGVGELIAFLYAYPFPKAEWSKRVDEAFREMRV